MTDKHLVSFTVEEIEYLLNTLPILVKQQAAQIAALRAGHSKNPRFENVTHADLALIVESQDTVIESLRAENKGFREQLQQTKTFIKYAYDRPEPEYVDRWPELDGGVGRRYDDSDSLRTYPELDGGIGHKYG